MCIFNDMHQHNLIENREVGEVGVVGEGSRKHKELKQDMAGKMRTPCWHTENRVHSL